MTRPLCMNCEHHNFECKKSCRQWKIYEFEKNISDKQKQKKLKKDTDIFVVEENRFKR